MVSILLLPTNLRLNDTERRLIMQFVEQGGTLIALGGTSGLEEVFACRDGGKVEEGWIGPSPQPRQGAGGASAPGTAAPIMEILRRGQALHAFGGRRLAVLSAQARELAVWLAPESWNEERGWDGAVAEGAAVVINDYGRGRAVLVAADVMQSIVRLQQGRPVHVDAPPAAAAELNDGILKVDDGIVLDFARDREIIGGVPIFARPMADEWRELVIRAILWGAQEAGLDIPLLWYWPDFVPAVGQISHDSDGNNPEMAQALLNLMQSLGIPSTWCIQYPGGYAPEFYQRLHQLGSEVALHFDARSGSIGTNWLEADLRRQWEWLREMSNLPVISNKNHYLRWEGLTEFFLWLERLGIKSDQTKGPTKIGVGGYPFGGSHPWFPLEEQTLRFIDVLEVPHQTWELVSRWPIAVGQVMVDKALENGGVAHFLFHPVVVGRSAAVANALSGIVAYGRERGMPWWTNAAIQDWERRRREVRLCGEHPPLSAGGGPLVWKVEAGRELKRAAILFFTGKTARSRQSGAIGASGEWVQAFGFPARLLVTDLVPGEVKQLS